VNIPLTGSANAGKPSSAQPACTAGETSNNKGSDRYFMALLTRGRKHYQNRGELSVITAQNLPSSLHANCQEEDEGGETAAQYAKSKVIGMMATLLVH
jgi:hypothetical protein